MNSTIFKNPWNKRSITEGFSFALFILLYSWVIWQVLFQHFQMCCESGSARSVTTWLPGSGFGPDPVWIRFRIRILYQSIKEFSEKVQYIIIFNDILHVWQHIYFSGHKNGSESVIITDSERGRYCPSSMWLYYC